MHSDIVRERIDKRKVFLENGCIITTYAQMKTNNRTDASINGKKTYTYRHVWELENGPIPKDKQINHHCDNGACINIDHLYLGTQADNVKDMHRRNRVVNTIAQTKPRRKLSEKKALAIREYYQPERVIILAKIFKITPAHLMKIVRRKVYANI